MNWVGLARLVAAARTPLQVAVLTYIGAGGMAGVAVVGVVLLTPAGQSVQQAIEPARVLVRNMLPADVPFTVAFDPRQELASRPMLPAAPVGIATQKSLGVSAPELAIDGLSPPAVDDLSLEASSVLASQDTSFRPSQVSQSSLPGPRPDAGQPATGVGVDVSPPLAAQLVQLSPALVLASVLPAATRPAEVPAAGPVVPTAVALATARPARVEVRSVPTNAQLAATAPLPTTVPDKSTPNRTRNDVPEISPEPTQVAVPTQVPVPTAIRVPPTTVPEDEKTPVPTSRPTQTPVPSRTATQAPVPVKSPTPRPTVKPTAVPTHPPATATPVKGKREREPIEPGREHPAHPVPPKG